MTSQVNTRLPSKRCCKTSCTCRRWNQGPVEPLASPPTNNSSTVLQPTPKAESPALDAHRPSTQRSVTSGWPISARTAAEAADSASQGSVDATTSGYSRRSRWHSSQVSFRKNSHEQQHQIQPAGQQHPQQRSSRPSSVQRHRPGTTPTSNIHDRHLNLKSSWRTKAQDPASGGQIVGRVTQ